MRGYEEVMAAPKELLISRESQLSVLELSRALVSHTSVGDLVEDLTRRLNEIDDYSYVAIIVYDEVQDAMRMHTVRTVTPLPYRASDLYSMEEAPSATVWRSQKPIVIADVEKENRFPTVMGWLRDNGVQSLCTVPLTTARRRLGALALGSGHRNAFVEGDLALPRMVADQVAVALESALNYQEAKAYEQQLIHEKERLTLLLEINNAVASNLSLPDLISAITRSVRQAMQCDAACLSLPEPGEKALRVRGLDFPSTNGYLQENFVFPIEGSSPGRALQTGKPVRYGHNPAYLNTAAAELNRREEFQSGCFIPVVRKGRSLGTIHLHDRHENKFEDDADVEFLARVANQVAIALDNALKYHEVKESRDQLEDHTSYLSNEIRTEHNFEEILGRSAALNNVLQQVRTVAGTDSTVLIHGETGTGKELIARAIHNHGKRYNQIFVKLNCAAIPLGLLESELFGHEKGAFTGAIAQKKGRFEIAHRGTLFLDEIGDIPLELQPKLLRVLQEQEFERLGSNHSIHVDVRLVTATNRDLARMVEEGTFRADLYYRLNVFPVFLPPLRERRGDIPELVKHFAQRFGQQLNHPIREIPPEVLNAMSAYEWPGNIRELQNVVERAVILSQHGVLRPEIGARKSPRIATTNPQRSDTLQDAEREHILKALRDSAWVLSGPEGAAAKLGVPRTTLIYKMKRLNVPRRPEEHA
jgi:formate hydrogenlyase transcriptional activator